MGWIKFFSSLDGRIGRKKFWLTSIVIFAAELVVMIFAAAVAEALSLSDGWIEIVLVAFLYPQFIVSVKRGHDRNIPVWIIAAYTVLATAHDELIQFGWLVRMPNQNVASSGNAMSFLVTMILAVVGLALFVELGFRKGTPGPNRYGPNPLGLA